METNKLTRAVFVELLGAIGDIVQKADKHDELLAVKGEEDEKLKSAENNSEMYSKWWREERAVTAKLQAEIEALKKGGNNGKE